MHSVFWNANSCRCSMITLSFSFQLFFRKGDQFSLWRKNLYGLDWDNKTTKHHLSVRSDVRFNHTEAMEVAEPGCRDLGLALLCFKLTCGFGKPKFSLLWSSVSLIWSLRGRARWCLEKILPFLISSVYNRRKQWHPTPVLLPGKSHGRRSLVGCRLWGPYESDTEAT